ncbi:MAG: 50S ribosomal protein L10 [Deltaproteobacteria bacterium]
MSTVKKAQKVDAVERLRQSIAAQKGAVIAENLGLTVAEVTNLRKTLREADVEFRVVKNTLIRLAAKDTGFEKLSDAFVGPTAVGFARTDPVALAKAMKEFAAGNPKFRLKAGYLDGKVLSGKEIEALADLPSREILLGKLVGALASPLRRLVQAMSDPPRKLVYALHSIHEKQSDQQTA